MRISCFSLLKVFLSVLWLLSVAIRAEVTLPNTQTKDIKSNINQQVYRLHIQLPANYTDTNKHYPVVYLLDAQWDFPLLSAIYGQQYYDGFLPELILVGITWGGENADANKLRRRDFTPSDMDGNGGSGQAATFLKVIDQEIIPFIDEQFRSNDNRTLMGSSLGGLFTLYAMFNQPQRFNQYIPSSPAVDWDDGVLYTSAKQYLKNPPPHPIKMFMPVSELETLYTPVMQMADFLTQQNLPNLQWQKHVVLGAGHSGVKAEGDTRGLQYVFAKPAINLTQVQLKQYTGLYQAANQPDIKIVLDKSLSQLSAVLKGKATSLLAANPQQFFHRGEFFKVNFHSSETNKVNGLTLNTFASSVNYTKVN
ncbi:alpha/beta hydrolase [Neptunicella marina]|uniref:Alpha/beta hydrolase n=1 Tax=Neptunicella marina TaxID=2125989 RepID=A0A8J6IT14_9ALTE|nr:alpha/beta hydrolase-fold protein [Neptunicella marina]MBC3765332.1 alpha/beta hydrolase [Neptunicella marina]